ncbi:MAG: SIMPL domain-containing protein [Verrucomicrobiota bacterium]|nr:SIMPL domain-containing protein [Verrucomicrobiota bacterium]
MKTLVFALLLLPGILFAEGGLPNEPYIYVEGKAEIKKAADLVTLRFELVTRNADLTKANQEVQAKASKILTMLDEQKVAQDDVVASDLRSEPQFQQEPGRPEDQGKVIGYVVRRPFVVKVRDLNRFPKLVDDLIALGGVEFSGISEGLAKEEEVEDEAWGTALADARSKAEKTLRTTDMKIRSVFAISPVNFPEISSRIFGGSMVAQSSAAYSERANVNPNQYRLTPVTVSQSVHVIYLISPAK